MLLLVTCLTKKTKYARKVEVYYIQNQCTSVENDLTYFCEIVGQSQYVI